MSGSKPNAPYDGQIIPNGSPSATGEEDGAYTPEIGRRSHTGQQQIRTGTFATVSLWRAQLSHKLNIIRKIFRDGQNISYEIADFYECEQDCHAREVAEILSIGRFDLKTGPLANLTAGGEGVSGLSDETRQRIDANLHGPDAPGERGIANRFFLQLCEEVRSVPVRPASKFTPEPLKPHPQPRKPTKRMAAALVASAIANRVLLEPNCIIPRKCIIPSKSNEEGVLSFIENGTGSDLLKAGLATLVAGHCAEDECFLLDNNAIRTLLSLSNPQLLLNAGVLMPTN